MYLPVPEEFTMAATKTKTPSVRSRIQRWRELADQWVDNHRHDIEPHKYDLETPPDFAKRVSFPKGASSGEKRAVLLPLVHHLLHNRLSNAESELAAWEMLGRLVVHNTMEDVDYCNDGDTGIRNAKRLLGEPVTFHFDVKLRDVPMPDNFDPDGNDINGLRITITNSKGVVLSERIKPDDITTNVDEGFF
jgi:hypothetical protein